MIAIRCAFVAFLLISVIPVHAQVARVVTLADSLVGAVGGVAVDRLGNVYSADFMDTVWRIRPDGRVTKFAENLYGASGNFFDARGRLLQSNFYADTISRIERDGSHDVWVSEGLNGPVGITIAADGDVYVCNCRDNTISRIDENQVARTFSEGPLFKCPNGITSTPDGTLYVANFNSGEIIRIDSTGSPDVFSTLPTPGTGHIAFARGALYVTGFQTHQIYRVSMDGSFEWVAGGAPGEVDGAPAESRFIFPNGIATAPSGDRLFVNDYINRSPPTMDIPPVPLANVRLIKLANLADMMAAALAEGGIEAMLATHTDYRENPATAASFTQVQINVLGYQLMGRGQLEEAIAVFRVNVGDYPNAFNTHDSLGEALMNASRDDEAVSSYQRSLELNPANQNARDMIERIQSGG